MSGIPDGPAALVGYAVAALTILTAWFRDKRKGDVDESALVLGKWKELVEQHQSDIKGIREEFIAYKTSAMAEIAVLRARVAELETENRTLRDELTGLKRAIAQNSQSTAIMLGRSTKRFEAGEGRLTGMEDEIAKLDRAGHNSGDGE